MPWYSEDLDYDLKEEIIKRNLATTNNKISSKFLDLGTGPGTQALYLSELGFDVTASDLSEYAIEKAEHLSNKINFIVDDILNSNLKEMNLKMYLIVVVFTFYQLIVGKDMLL